MIRNILDLLKTDHFYNVSEEVEIAKGKYKIPEGRKEIVHNIKRRLKWELKER